MNRHLKITWTLLWITVLYGAVMALGIFTFGCAHKPRYKHKYDTCYTRCVKAGKTIHRCRMRCGS